MKRSLPPPGTHAPNISVRHPLHRPPSGVWVPTYARITPPDRDCRIPPPKKLISMPILGHRPILNDPQPLGGRYVSRCFLILLAASRLCGRPLIDPFSESHFLLSLLHHSNNLRSQCSTTPPWLLLLLSADAPPRPPSAIICRRAERERNVSHDHVSHF